TKPQILLGLLNPNRNICCDFFLLIPPCAGQIGGGYFARLSDIPFIPQKKRSF
uniref:Uncharacterized protein n=1 Tax=Oryza brachyantha TaxID=4533 RepID=J3MMX5_ORYBR